MIVIPAIDIRGGKVVRWTQGAADKETVYSDSPIDVAGRWASCGAKFIHLVDLDGAMKGEFKNLGLIKEMVRKIDAGFEIGGGIRDEAIIKEVLDSGVEKVVLGTRAFDKEFLYMVTKKYGSRIVIGIDAKDGIVHTKGWVFKTGIKATDFVRQVDELGIDTINYTDISRDGMLKGPNLAGLKELLKATRLKVVASGGVSTLEDLKQLKAIADDRLVGAIVGKALYEGTIDLKEAIRICSQNG